MAEMAPAFATDRKKEGIYERKFECIARHIFSVATVLKTVSELKSA